MQRNSSGPLAGAGSGPAAPGTAPPSDRQLVADARAGRPHAYEAIMRRYNRRLFRIARGILRDESEAEDVVQETYVKLFTRLESFRGPDGFGSWLCRIAGNDALDRARQASLRGAPLDAPAQLSRAPGPAEVTAGGELARSLEAAVDRLPDDFRGVFMLRAIEQLSVAETAACLGIRPATVKTRYFRARRLLRRDIEQRLQSTLEDLFPFAGRRCDRIVARVFERLARLPHQA